MKNNKEWIVRAPEKDGDRLALELKIHPAIVSLLLRRGLKNASEIFSFLNPSLDSLESPFVFSDMEKAVLRIRQAIEKREKILVYGDYDVDGITGSAILYPLLKKMGAEVESYIPHRLNEGYGLNLEALKELLKKKFKLVITVDNGITGIEPIQFLFENHVDTIIVDHHLPKEKLPNAYAIVSANSGDKKGDPNLAACGLAFKLGWALMGNLEAVKDYLDLVAVGTVADLAPVLGENRVILKHGLPILSKSKRVGFRALFNVARLSQAFVSYRDIAFGLGPRINASGRMGSPENAFKLLVTENEREAQNLAQILEEGNRDRQRVESEAFEEALERVELDSLSKDHAILVVDSPSWHEGVLGIVASRLVERYEKPSIVISHRGSVGKGSGRSTPHFKLFDTVLACEDLLVNFGGHAQACGLTIKKENVSMFRNRINKAAEKYLTATEAAGELEVSSELLLSELNFDFLKDLEKCAPFGPGHPKPLFMSKTLKIKGEPKKRGKDTLQAWVTDGGGKTTCEVIGFRQFSRWNGGGSGKFYDMIYQPALKNFNGINSIQLELEDWRYAAET